MLAVSSRQVKVGTLNKELGSIRLYFFFIFCFQKFLLPVFISSSSPSPTPFNFHVHDFHCNKLLKNFGLGSSCDLWELVYLVEVTDSMLSQSASCEFLLRYDHHHSV